MILLSNSTLILTDALSDVSREFHLRPNTLSGTSNSSQGGPSKMSFDTNNNFISFCFGGDYDWMKATLLLLTADGHVFYLCPLLPNGAQVPKSTVESLYAWVEEEVEGNDKMLSARAASAASKELRSYLRAVFEQSEARSCAGEIQDHRWGTSDVICEDDEVVWGSYSPILQGPLDMIVSGESDESSARHSNVKACDICVPASGTSTTSSERAPIIAIAYSNGNIDLFTAAASSVGPFIWPMWPSLANTLATWQGGQGWDRDRLVPALNLVETVSIPHAVEGSTLPHLKLSPDPIHTHYLHLSNTKNGAAYFISVSWLKRALQQVSEVVASSASLDFDSSHETFDRIEKDYLGTEDCEPSSVCQIQNAASVGVSGIRRHCGMCVISDAMLGHLAMHRIIDGEIVATNVTTCARLHQYRELVGGRQRRSETFNSGGTPSDSFSELGRGSYEKRAALLVETIQLGLDTVPLPTEDEGEEETLAATKKKQLLAASRHLNEKVILPLEDLAHRTISALDSTKDIYDDQVRFLQGPGGFNSKLQALNDSHKAALTRRIDSIGTRLLQQRTRARELLAKYASQNANRATEQEKAYARQLTEWKAQLGVMQSKLTNLGAMVKVCTGEVLLRMDGKSASKQSLLAQHGVDRSLRASTIPW